MSTPTRRRELQVVLLFGTLIGAIGSAIAVIYLPAGADTFKLPLLVTGPMLTGLFLTPRWGGAFRLTFTRTSSFFLIFVFLDSMPILHSWFWLFSAREPAGVVHV